jgi:hypothetical protein
MVAMAAGPTPQLTHDQADQALARLTNESDRIAGALIALESHPGHQFLAGARLSGRTEELWQRTQGDITLLYQRFNAYRSVLERATAVRARRARPGVAELTELSALLRGRSVELATEEIPLERRNLTGPSTVTNRMTLAELVTAMDTMFQRATEVVVATDDVWSAFVHLADPLEGRLDAARELAASLGLGEARDPLFTTLGDVGTDLADVRARAFGDPLSFYRGEPGKGQPDLGEIDALDSRLAQVRVDLDAQAAVRGGYDEQVGRARAAIDGLAALAVETRALYDRVLDKIAAPTIAEVPMDADGLRARLAGLGDLVARQRWSTLSGELAALATATDDAVRRVRDVRDTANALLDRRSELRGRLDAYRVKAARSHLTEDAEIAGTYQQAYDLLWSAPCDLRAATMALNRYQQAIAAKGSAG